MNSDMFSGLKSDISKANKIVNELSGMLDSENEEQNMMSSHADSLRKELNKLNNSISDKIKSIGVPKPLPKKSEANAETKNQKPKKQGMKNKVKNVISALEKNTLKRLGKKEKKVEKKKEKKPSKYVSISNKYFSGISQFFINKGMFGSLEKDLIKANMKFLPKSYVSVALFTTLLSAVAAFLIFLFLMFFNLVVTPPFIVFREESMGLRFLKTFWILIVIPIGTLVFTYFYPAMEKRSIEGKIDRELPFATINMSAISGSMIEPSQIFSIIIETKEYPNVEKEFSKIINGINVLGHDLVTSLRNGAFSSPSKKLSDLFNGLATTINSGGDLRKFFSERSERLLFEYNLEKEKSTRTAETFMDIYISVVIAAPMILMLLLMMMQISGIGIALSTGMITLIMVLGVISVNIMFLTFLHLKQSNV